MVVHLFFLPEVVLFLLLDGATWADCAVLVAHYKIHVKLPSKFVGPAEVLAILKVLFDVGNDVFRKALLLKSTLLGGEFFRHRFPPVFCLVCV